MSRITELNDELQAVRDQKAYLIRHGAENTDQRIVDSEEREAELFRKISEEESKAKTQVIIAGAQDPESSFTLTVGDYTVDFRTEAASEESYQALRIATELTLQQLEEQNQAEIRALKASYESERQQLEQQIANVQSVASAVQDAYSTSQQTVIQFKEQLAEQAIVIKDLEGKRDIAANEAESLRAQVEELRSQVSKPSVPTNLDSSALSDAMQKLRDSKRAIYDVQKDSANINYTAKFVDNDETFTDKLIYIGKYRQMSNEEAQRFQQEAEQAKQTELESTPEAEITPEPVEDFRNDLPAPDLSDVDATNGLDENVTEREDGQNGEGGASTVEARLTALELAVFGQARVAA